VSPPCARSGWSLERLKKPPLLDISRQRDGEAEDHPSSNFLVALLLTALPGEVKGFGNTPGLVGASRQARWSQPSSSIGSGVAALPPRRLESAPLVNRRAAQIELWVRVPRSRSSFFPKAANATLVFEFFDETWFEK